jgi:hypothetical protein
MRHIREVVEFEANRFLMFVRDKLISIPDPWVHA